MGSVTWSKRIGLLIIIASLFLMGITSYTQSKVRKYVKPKLHRAGVMSEGFQLSIAADKTRFMAGEPIAVMLLLKNISAEERQVTGASPYKVYKFTVKDKRGRDAALTEFGQELANAAEDFLERFVRTMAPGEEVQEQIEINKIFKMDAPGLYSVGAKRTVFKRRGEGTSELVSNTLEITITN